jgi:hypothetical protein
MFIVGGAGAFAQFEGGAFGLGARIVGFAPFYDPGTDIKDRASGLDVELEGKLNFGFALQASYNFTDLLGVQAEGIYNTDNVDMEVTGKKVVSVKGSSFQLPILLKIGRVLDNNMYLGGIGGVYFTVPVGEGELTIVGYGSDSDIWKGSVGFMAGGVIGVVLGPGILFADIRSGMDFSEVEFEYYGETIKAFKKSNIEIGVGYTLSLGGY